MNFKKVFYFIIVLLFISGCFFLFRGGVASQSEQNLQANSIRYIKIAGQTVKVDLALTPAAQAQGLSGRLGLQEDEGMLFVFNKPSRYSFWMKDMNFPIDMIWLNENLQVIYIEKNAQPDLYPNTFTPDTDAKYVLEVSANFSEKNNLKLGDSTQFLP